MITFKILTNLIDLIQFEVMIGLSEGHLSDYFHFFVWCMSVRWSDLSKCQTISIDQTKKVYWLHLELWDKSWNDYWCEEPVL